MKDSVHLELHLLLVLRSVVSIAPQHVQALKVGALIRQVQNG
jgi:hypothetical protein